MNDAKVVRLREREDRGHRAKQILENPLFIEATKKARENIISEQELTRWDEAEKREFLDKELRALKRIVGHLQNVMIDGDAASKELRMPSKFGRLKRGT